MANQPNRYCVDHLQVSGRVGADYGGECGLSIPQIAYNRLQLKAAVNRLHSKRFAKFKDARQSRQRLDCACFSTALDSMLDVGRSMFDVSHANKKARSHERAWKYFDLSPVRR
jgi:hypothetical protein